MNQKGFSSIILVVVAALLIVGAGMYFILAKKSNTSMMQSVQQIQTTTQTSTTTQTVPITSVTNDSDIERVRVIMGEIRSGYLEGDKNKILQHFSSTTQSLFINNNLPKISDLTTNKIYRSGEFIIARVTITAISESGELNKGNSNIFFIKEGGDWKLQEPRPTNSEY